MQKKEGVIYRTEDEGTTSTSSSKLDKKSPRDSNSVTKPLQLTTANARAIYDFGFDEGKKKEKINNLEKRIKKVEDQIVEVEKDVSIIRKIRKIIESLKSIFPFLKNSTE